MYNSTSGKPKDKINAMRRKAYAENKEAINAQKRDAYQKRKELNSSAAEEINVNYKKLLIDKMKIYKEFIENRKSIYTLIFEELDSLFYGLV